MADTSVVRTGFVQELIELFGQRDDVVVSTVSRADIDSDGEVERGMPQLLFDGQLANCRLYLRRVLQVRLVHGRFLGGERGGAAGPPLDPRQDSGSSASSSS